VSTGIEQEASAALHRAVDQLVPPLVDLDAIRRAARRRKARVAAAAVVAVIAVAAGAAAALTRSAASPARRSARARAGLGPAAPVRSD
jgi:hypothetical protein